MADPRQRASVPQDHSRQNRVPEDAIRNRAHEIYEQRGGDSGHDIDDWLQAERELRKKDK